MNDLIYVLSNEENFQKDALAAFKRINGFFPSVNKITSTNELEEKILSSASACFCLIDLTSIDSKFPALLQKISLRSKNVHFIGAGSPPDVSTMMSLVKAGIKNFVSYPFTEGELSSLFQNEEDVAVNAKTKTAKIVTLYSPKGGTGVTLLTTNLAVALLHGSENRKSSDKTKIVVCDFSPQCGDISTYLNINPKYTIRDIIDNHTILDESFLQGILVSHASGVTVLPSPREDQEPPNSNHLNIIKSIIQLLRKNYDYILVDGGYLDRTLLQYVMSESDLTFLVGNPDVVSLKGLVTFFNKLKDLKYDTEKIKILINRYNSKNQIDAKEFEKMLRHPITATLPNNYMLCIQAVNSGQTMTEIQDKSDLVKKINELADIIRKI